VLGPPVGGINATSGLTPETLALDSPWRIIHRGRTLGCREEMRAGAGGREGDRVSDEERVREGREKGREGEIDVGTCHGFAVLVVTLEYHARSHDEQK